MAPFAAMANSTAFLLVFLVVFVGLGLLLWSAIDSESAAERSEHPDWDSAEREARKDRDEWN